MFIALITVGLTLNVGALMVSTHAPAKRARSGGVAGVLFVSFFAVPALMNVLMVTSSTKSLETRCVGFFAADVPVLLLVSFFALYYAAWMFKGVTRVLSRENEPLFSRGGGAGFMLGHIVLMLGLAWPHFTPRDFPGPIYGFWLAGLFPLFFIPLGSVKTFEKYFEESGATAGPRPQGAGAFLLRSNLSYWLALGGLWAASSLIVGLATGLVPLLSLYEVVVILSFCLVFFFLLELSILYMPVYNKIGVLIAVFTVIVIVLPLWLSGIFGKSNLHMFCLPGFAWELLQDETSPRLPIFHLVLAYNLALSLVPLWLVLRRYQFIVTARRGM